MGQSSVAVGTQPKLTETSNRGGLFRVGVYIDHIRNSLAFCSHFESKTLTLLNSSRNLILHEKNHLIKNVVFKNLKCFVFIAKLLISYALNPKKRNLFQLGIFGI